MKEVPYQKKVNAKGKSVLLISDLHAPYSHRDSYKFLKAIKKKYNPDIIINLGDEIDGHAISFHNSESSLLNPDAELDRAIDEMQELHEIFPKMLLAESNHGSLVYRRLKAENIPIRTLKPLDQLYGTPGWEWYHEILLDTHMGKTLVVHGKTSSYGKFAKEQGCNGIQGHFHGKAEVTFHQSSTLLRYNMLCGCLVDHKSMAFAYGKNHLPKPIHAVGFIDPNGEPRLIRMHLNKRGYWDGNL